MKHSIVETLRSISPRALDRAVELRGHLPASHQRVRRLEESLQNETVFMLVEALAELRAEVAELRAELNECRGDALRIAELTDIVEQRLSGTNPEQP
ncbi:hypothetical protein EDD28_0315 [Salana multivorans]|uniref:DUF6752 domain-containing protein n=1 Tax=Salana multivorans TaxID=120377 RepID=A0A3N2D7I3_9MICO|nr:DUF6752 domain-containing protein [Salana multivorans]ROR95753.1 hypothetical protein EDD28_0315 [Salana multivorans]